MNLVENSVDPDQLAGILCTTLFDPQFLFH